VKRYSVTAGWSSGKVLACSTAGPGIKSWPGRFYNNEQNLSSCQSPTCDIMSEGALYSVFYAEASKRPHTREQGVP